VLYAPGLRSADEVRAVCEAVSKPVNVLARPEFTLAEAVEAGAQRISVGGRLGLVGVKAIVKAALAIRDEGDFSLQDVRLPLQEWFTNASAERRPE
jgi:2-methylisocitrate lyase-like PEP mutase family enzyme